MNRSHEFGDMPFGQTRVQYTASDATGNSRTCVIVVSVQDNFCPQLDEPKYGFINCDMNLNNLKECYHECNSQRYGIAMHSYMESYHVCEDDGVWHPAVRLPIDCSHQRYSNELIKGYRMSYRLTTENTCNDTNFLESVRLHLVARLTPRVPHWCRPRETGINCTLVSVEVTCVTEEVIEVTTASPSNNYDYDADEYYD
uniref:HYR domain-containing protein n=2 Tax=Ciona intestinalis TaxID=7719 RepID=F6Z5J1_CIOIN